MSKFDNSSSEYQRKLEDRLFMETQRRLGIELESNPNLLVQSDPTVSIVPDFYSKEHCIIGEIHAHAGKLKGGQPDKIAADILKMLLHDKIMGCTFQKYIVVCSKEEYQQLTGTSALAEAIRQFDIRVLLIPLEEKEYEELQTVMKKQDFLQRTEEDYAKR